MRIPERPDGALPRRGDHACILYGHGRGERALAARFIASGLAGGERCLYVSARANVSGIVDALEHEGVDVVDQVALGALRLTTAARTYLPDGTFSPGAMLRSLEIAVADSRASGYTGLRATGEMGWAAADRAHGVLARYEADLARAFAAGGLTGLCQYDRAEFPEELIEAMCALHPVVIETRTAGARAPDIAASYGSLGAD